MTLAGHTTLYCAIARTSAAHAVRVELGAAIPPKAKSLCGIRVWTLGRHFLGAGNRCGNCTRLSGRGA